MTRLTLLLGGLLAACSFVSAIEADAGDTDAALAPDAEVDGDSLVGCVDGSADVDPECVTPLGDYYLDVWLPEEPNECMAAGLRAIDPPMPFMTLEEPLGIVDFSAPCGWYHWDITWDWTDSGGTTYRCLLDVDIDFGPIGPECGHLRLSNCIADGRRAAFDCVFGLVPTPDPRP